MDKVLFVVRNYSFAGAQPLRFRNIVSHLSSKFEVHILEFGTTYEDIITPNGVAIHRRKYTKMGAIINGKTGRNYAAANARPFKKRRSAKQRIGRIIKKMFFPDPFVTEALRLKKEVRQLSKQYNFQYVVGSAHPFTILKLAPVVKKLNIPFIYDIGDPFFGSSSRKGLKKQLAYSYENRLLKHISILVVTNEPTKKFYLDNFPFLEEKIFIVEQGVILSPDIEHERTTPSSEVLEMLYAGQFYRGFREPFELFAAIEQLNSSEKVCQLDIYGNISEHFKDTTAREVNFLGHRTNEEILDLMYESHIVIFIDNAYGLQTPGKIFEVIATKKPILFIYENNKTPAYSIAKDFPNVFFARNQKESIMSAIIQIQAALPITYSFDVDMFSWHNRAKDFENAVLSVSI